MPPGSDVVVATQGAGLTAAQRLAGSSVSTPPKLTVETAGLNKPTEQSNLSARERLRAHVHRNLQIQQDAARQAAEKALAAGEKAPEVKSTTSSPLAAPTSSAAALLGLREGSKPNGLEKLYAPIQDTRLGVSDISGSSTPKAAPAVPEGLREVPLDMSLDAGGLSGAEPEGELEEGGFAGEAEPFLEGSEWSGLDTVDHLYYSSGSGGGTKEGVVVDDEWVQGIYDMEGMAPDA